MFSSFRTKLLIAALAVGACLPGTARADRTTFFDADLEGWRITGDNASVWQAAGGNPGGCLDVNDLVTGEVNCAVAPGAYLGDWSSFTAGDSILLDYHFVSGGPRLSNPFTFELYGPGGVARSGAGYVPPAGAWTTKGVSLDPSEWVIEWGSWEAILAQVTRLMIVAEFVNGSEEVQLDNIRLTGDPVPVFSPCENETFSESGLGDWSFQSTGGVSNPGSDGNAGGFCRVADAAGTSLAFAPARFLGDWSSFDGSGEVTIDIRTISRGGPAVGAAEFLRLSGPGGTASVALSPADIPLGAMVWKRLAYPLNPGVWTVTSGTWAGLLADVAECRIVAEWISGTEVVGLDNFARRSLACPALDDSVVTQVPDVTRCGVLSHIRLATVALNPADGELYGTVGPGGADRGLYRASGDSAGVRLQDYAAPTALICDAGGNVFVSADGPGTIFRRTPEGVWSTWVSGFHSGDDDPAGMCFAPPGFSGPSVSPGDILVTDWGNGGADEIWAFSPSVAEGELLVMPDPGTLNIKDIATGPDGVVYAADELDSTRIYRLTPEGTLVAIPLAQPARTMSSIAYDAVAGRVYVAAAGDLTLRRIDPATGAVETVAGGFASFAPGCLELDSASRRLWLADAAANRVYEFCLTGEATSVEAGAMPAAGAPSPATPVAGGILSPVAVSPNPARGEMTLRFALARDAWTEIEVFDVGGRLVRRLEGTSLAAGRRTAAWDGRGSDGRRVADGLYMVRVRAGAETRTARAIVTR